MLLFIVVGYAHRLCFLLQVAQWFSQLGGGFGLWLGCSAFTLMELFELVIDLVTFTLFKRARVERKIVPSEA